MKIGGEMKSPVNDLASAIDQWLAKRKTRNLNLLSRLSGVSYATVRRLSLKECKASAEVAAAIAGIVLPRDEAVELIKREFPSFAAMLISENNFSKADSDDLQLYYSSDKHYPVLVLAQAQEGIDEKIVTAQLGRKFVSYFTELCECNLLTLQGDRYHLNVDLGAASKEIARMHLKSLLSLTGNQNDDIPSASGAFTLSASLNKETVNKLKEKLASVHQELFQIIEDKNNAGDIVWYGGWLNNIMLNEGKLS